MRRWTRGKNQKKEIKKERKKEVAINALNRENLETETIHEYQKWLGLNQKRANIGPKEWKVWNFGPIYGSEWQQVVFSQKNMSIGLSLECYEFMISSPKYSTWQMQAIYYKSATKEMQVCDKVCIQAITTHY